MLAYLVNQYPQPSQTFIRREIRAHEAAGTPVLRFSIRGATGPLPDPVDAEERARTRVILSSGGVGLLSAGVRTLIGSPGRFLRVLRAAFVDGRRSDTGVVKHLIYLAEACQLRFWLVRAEVTHVHAHFGTNSACVARYCALLGGPGYSFTVHGPEEFDRASGLGLQAKVAGSRFVAGVSRYGRGQLMRWTSPDDWDRIEVVRCGLDTGFLSSPDPTPDPTPDGSTPAYNVLCVGRLVEQKGQLLLVRAAAVLRDRRRPVTVRIVGEGPLRRRLQAEIERLGLEGHVTLTGVASSAQVRAAMQHAKVVAVPSLAEGLPVVLMEAMALRRPVVTTAVAGIPELVTDGVCGWVVQAGDAEALADALDDACSAEPARLNVLADAGRQRVLQFHDAAKEAARLRDLFRRYGCLREEPERVR